MQKEQKKEQKNFFQKSKEFSKNFGPGVITGASDDDPSGILTYIQSGVVMGLQSLWVALVTLPLMYGIQETCARIGYVTGKGLVSLLKSQFAKWFVFVLVLISALIIVVNIGADLLAMSVVLEKAIPIPRVVWVWVLGASILAGVILFSYRSMARILKWLSLALLCYVAVAFFVSANWKEALFHTIVPSFGITKDSFYLIAAIVGTTISPYLFFWQASEETEEREHTDLRIHRKIFKPDNTILRVIRKDTFLGMLFSNIIMWFILLTAHQLADAQGLGVITSFDEAALVLRPLLGPWAYFAFSVGIIGTGFLAIPVLAGSVGYMLSELFDWKEGLNKKFHEAHGFYWSIVSAIVLGCVVVIAHGNPVSLLIAAAALYALITPILVFVIMRIANKPAIMGGFVNTLLENVLGGLVFAATLAAAILCVWALFG